MREKRMLKANNPMWWRGVGSSAATSAVVAFAMASYVTMRDSSDGGLSRGDSPSPRALWGEQTVPLAMGSEFETVYGRHTSKIVSYPTNPEAALAIGTDRIGNPLYEFYLRKDRNLPLEVVAENQDRGNRSVVEFRALNGWGGAADFGITGGYQDGSDMPTNTAFVVAESPVKGGLYLRTNGESPLRLGVRGKEVARISEHGRLGVGVKDPEQAIDVAGRVRAREGLIAPSVGNPDGNLVLQALSGVQLHAAIGLGQPTLLVAWAGRILPSGSFHLVDGGENTGETTCRVIEAGERYPQGALLVLAGARDGMHFVIERAEGARGNLRLADDFVFRGKHDLLTLIRRDNEWFEVSRVQTRSTTSEDLAAQARVDR